jgi:hypothetical protein
MIFSLERYVAPACSDLQYTCKIPDFLSLVCSGLHKFSSPVVSEWCQKGYGGKPVRHPYPTIRLTYADPESRRADSNRFPAQYE